MNATSLNSNRHRIFGEMRRIGATLCACAFALLGSQPLHAAPGDLDPSFGEGGHTAFSFPGHPYAFPHASVLQANGKLTFAGECTVLPVRRICALRQLRDGSPDVSFGVEGRVVLAGMVKAFASSLVYQQDGKLLLGGYCELDAIVVGMCVARLNGDGSLDNSFGSNGVTVFNIDETYIQQSYVVSLHLDRQGGIAVGGRCVASPADERFCAALLRDDGSLNTSFGTRGSLLVAPETALGRHQTTESITRDDFGRWWLVGTCRAPSPEFFCAVRLLPGGLRDPSFGTEGAWVYQFTGFAATVRAHHLDGEDRLVVLGNCREPLAARPCLAAITAAGRLDTSFGANGTIVVGLATMYMNPDNFVRQHNGELLIAGSCFSDQFRNDFCSLRMRSDGTWDLRLPLKKDSRSYDQQSTSVAIDAQGRIVISGGCKTTANGDYDQFCATRFEGGPFANTLCSFDLDGDGLVTPRVDGLILLRATLGFSANSILQGVNFPAGAKRTIWGGGGANDLRQYLVAQCGMSIAPLA